ncbi:hypothetical protein QTQ03_25475 [Micromonospora sp. WMMA1363]|uniref:hypothetical protein n=1 Tax=Micromonospora sp. WMMA1363 TaxID=3053985 RepID=UPI00259CE120|nr:hypothetical protein [Micromonospora sp. WMMA1363]MDM4722787.1 hypothetical protein [Micromonospora sp. WMMA1363]
MSPAAAEAIVLRHLTRDLPDLSDTELAEVAAEHAVETGHYAEQARRLIAAEHARRHPLTTGGQR